MSLRPLQTRCLLNKKSRCQYFHCLELHDLLQRAVPHNKFKIVFSDTTMEVSDTYDSLTVSYISYMDRIFSLTTLFFYVTIRATWRFAMLFFEKILW